MAFDEKYYREKLIALNIRIGQKKTNALNEILASLQRYLNEEKEIMGDVEEIGKRMKGAKEGLVDKEGKPVKVKEPAKLDKPKEKKI